MRYLSGGGSNDEGRWAALTAGFPYCDHPWAAVWFKEDGRVEFGIRIAGPNGLVTRKVEITIEEYFRLVQLIADNAIDLSTHKTEPPLPTARSVVV